jgi:hypothetical protein
MQCGALVAVLGSNVCPLTQQQRRSTTVPLECCNVQRPCAYAVLRVHVGAAGDQPSSSLGLALRTCAVKRLPAMGVRIMNVSTCAGQKLKERNGANASGHVERCLLLLAAGIDFSPVLQQQRRDAAVPKVSSGVKRAIGPEALSVDVCAAGNQPSGSFSLA